MKSPTTLRTSGFLISEILIAFSLMTLLLTSAVLLSSTMEELRKVAVKKLERLEFVAANIASSTLMVKSLYGNESVENEIEPHKFITSDYHAGWGRDNCDVRFSFNPQKLKLSITDLNLGSGNGSTDLEVRNGIAYMTSDSNSASAPDLYIIDMNNPDSPTLLSSLNTGPGLSALEVAGPYIYVANLGTTNELQVIDIFNRSSPQIIARYRLPLPRASSTPPFATAIFYSKGFVYLGTEKWEGAEFSVIDVTIPSDPHYVGGFETNTLVTDIHVRDGLAYVAASDAGQMRVLDIKNPGAITQAHYFSPSGWETQQGKILSYFEGKLLLGRTTGGFNSLQNHELFLFSSSTDPDATHDIPGGVYGIVERQKYVALATRSPGHEFQIWNENISSKVLEMNLGFQPAALTCDNQSFYFATGDSGGLAVITTE